MEDEFCNAALYGATSLMEKLGVLLMYGILMLIIKVSYSSYEGTWWLNWLTSGIWFGLAVLLIGFALITRFLRAQCYMAKNFAVLLLSMLMFARQMVLNQPSEMEYPLFQVLIMVASQHLGSTRFVHTIMSTLF